MTKTIEIFAALGDRLRGFGDDEASRRVVAEAIAANPWFTPREIAYAVEAIRTQMLDSGKLCRFAGRYPIPVAKPRSVGVIMAGNIPLVGFYDMLCVVLAGHNCLVKSSSKDRVLTQYIAGLLHELDPGVPVFDLDGAYVLAEGPAPQPAGNSPLDALIATGSDNANRYFRAQYSGIPSILRGSRHSAAILRGDESARQLAGLAEDAFLYSGLGCRSVSRIFVPAEYDLQRLCDALRGYETRINPKLRRSCLQRRAILTMNGIEIADGGFFVMYETPGEAAGRGSAGETANVSTGEVADAPLREPVGAEDGFPASPGEIVVTRYRDPAHLTYLVGQLEPQLQCIVADGFPHRACVPFGMAQRPGLGDFPDGVDVVSFLAGIGGVANPAE